MIGTRSSWLRALRAPCIALATAALAIGCGGGGSERVAERSSATADGWYVNLPRPSGGTVASSDGRIRCGVGGALCGDAKGWTQFPLGQASVTLTATPDAARGWTFVQWAGACTGTTPTCTVPGGANRWVGAIFRSPTHASGPSRAFSVYGVQVFNSGGGTAYSDDGWVICRSGSCSGYYAWSTVAVLQAVPDPGYQLATWAGDCGTDGACTLSTTPYGADKYVVPVFDAIPNIAHPNYSLQSLHGPAYLEFLGGRPGARQCSNAACHGPTLNGAGIAPSCHTCHASAGWTGWQTNCSFCHGARNAQTMAGYASSAHPTWAAPPDAVAQRLDPARAAVPSRTGAHQAHLAGATAAGLSFAAPFACATCHTVPTDLGHVDGADQRAVVTLSGAGQASLAASLGTYDPVSGTCSTYCHGASPSPAWSATGLVCGSCHAVPPAPSTGHPDVGPSLGSCVGCHPGSVLADGTIDLAGGKHLDGTVEASGGGGGAHPLHLNGGLACTVCHRTVIGIVSFDPLGPAVSPSLPAPGFDTAAKTCSNVACHSVTPGVFVPRDYPDDPYAWPYGGGSVTPSWYASPGANGCTACHGNPPTGNGGVWHSGWHGGVSVTSTRNPDVYGYNACSTCHPDVASTITGGGTPGGAITTTIATPALHRNGAVEVRYWDPDRWNQDRCDGCHYGF
jgi:predicted CxxxxCH...CXXCH cytochrome family protein